MSEIPRLSICSYSRKLDTTESVKSVNGPDYEQLMKDYQELSEGHGKISSGYACGGT